MDATPCYDTQFLPGLEKPSKSNPVESRMESCLEQIEPLQQKTSVTTHPREVQHSHKIPCTGFQEEESTCRICQCGPTTEALITPCRCRGSIAMVHKSCIQAWLSLSNSSVCEICKSELHVVRVQKGFLDWIRQPGSYLDRRNLVMDLLCLLILVPLCTTSTWLCSKGAKEYFQKHNNSNVIYIAMSFITIATALLLVFIIWLLLTVRYHYNVWRQWQKHNSKAQILYSNPIHLAPLHLSTMTDVPESADHLICTSKFCRPTRQGIVSLSNMEANQCRLAAVPSCNTTERKWQETTV